MDVTPDATPDDRTHPIWSTLAAKIATWTRLGGTQRPPGPIVVGILAGQSIYLHYSLLWMLAQATLYFDA